MFSVTALSDFLACRHIATLDRARQKGEVTKPCFADSQNELLKQLGLAHERRYLNQLTDAEDLDVVQIEISSEWPETAAETSKALRNGVDAVYQATFFEPPWYGRAVK